MHTHSLSTGWQLEYKIFRSGDEITQLSTKGTRSGTSVGRTQLEGFAFRSNTVGIERGYFVTLSDIFNIQLCCYPVGWFITQLCSPDMIQGRKPTLQYELSGGITLLSPAYLLSIKRHPFHKVMPDHYKHGKFVSLPSCSSYHSYSPASFIAIIL